MVERCCRVRRCGRVSREVSRAVSLRAKDVVGIVVGIAEDGDGIVVVAAMTRRGVAGIVRVRHGRSIVRSRAGSIRRRLCFRR
jgi:hypothetical protein